MITLAVFLATFWVWEYMDKHMSWIPETVSYLLVPCIAFGLALLPYPFVMPMAVAALVGILYRLLSLVNRTPISIPKRRSNIPPLP